MFRIEVHNPSSQISPDTISGMNQAHDQSKMNEAELLIYRVCRHSFLSLWSYMNPKKKPQGKELCEFFFTLRDIRPFKEETPHRMALTADCGRMTGRHRSDDQPTDRIREVVRRVCDS